MLFRLIEAERQEVRDERKLRVFGGSARNLRAQLYETEFNHSYSNLHVADESEVLKKPTEKSVFHLPPSLPPSLQQI